MESKRTNRKEINLKEFFIEYKNDLEKYLVNGRGIKEKVYTVEINDNKVINEINLIDIKELLEEATTLYLPVTTAIYDDMVIINGDMVDLNDGLEAEYVEGLTYMPTSGRLIDIGELGVSINSQAGIIMEIAEDFIDISLVEGKVDKDLNLKSFRNIVNGGIVSVEMKKYLDKKLYK